MRRSAWALPAIAAAVVSAANAAGAAAADRPAPPISGRCAAARIQAWGGAYFRKIISLPDADSRGLSAQGRLPRFYYDLLRYYSPKDPALEWQIGPLDRASVYVGGNGGGKELDAGLTWNRVYDASGRPAFTDGLAGDDGGRPARRLFKTVLDGQPAVVDGNGKVVARGAAAVARRMMLVQPDYAFRPFWRTTNSGGNQWNVPAPGAADNVYFYPAHDFSIRLELIAPETFRMVIASGKTRFSKTFHQDGFRVGEGAPLHTFKRVDSIDQYMLDSKGRHGNENADVIATDAKALGLRWKRVVVLKPSGELPLAGPDCVEVRGHDTDPSYARIFRVSGLTPEGGERIDILASGLKRP